MKQTFEVNLPFPFRFYGEEESTMSLFSGGVLGFPGGQSISISNTALGDTAAPNGLVSVFWGDLELLTSNNGFLATSVTGNAPERQFCIEWKNFNDEQVNGALLNFKVVLHEGAAGRLEVHYGAATGGTGSYSATMGMEDQRGGRAFDFNPTACSPNCDDAQFRALSGKKLTFIAPSLDVVATSVEAPSFGFIGASGLADVGVASINDAPLGPFEVLLEIADNPEMVGSTVAGTTQVSLGAFEARTVATPFVVPNTFAPNQRVWLAAKVDAGNTIPEVDEDNNSVVSDSSIILIAGGPNLAVVTASASAGRAMPGGQIQVSATVANRGSLAATAEFAVVLSTNPVISGNDAQLASTPRTLDPGASEAIVFDFTLPTDLRPGRYTLGVMADPAGLVNEIDEIDNGRATGSLEIVGQSLIIQTRNLPAARLGSIYSARVEAIGGSGDFEYRIAAGTPPAGIGFEGGTGEFYGRPTMVETARLTIEVSDSNDPSLSEQVELELQVIDQAQPLTVVTRNLPVATVGSPFSFQLVAAGGDPNLVGDRTWSASDLPEGMMVSEDGVVSGEARLAGLELFEVSVTDGVQTASRMLELEVFDSLALSVEAEPLEPALLRTMYRHQFTASGGEPPLTWTFSDDGGLGDSGLDLDPSGALSGTPAEAGRFRFTVRVIDGVGISDEATFVLDVMPDGTLMITTESLPDAFVGESYDRTVAAVGGLPPYDWKVLGGTIPDGLEILSARGPELRLVGVPVETSETTLLVQAMDDEGRLAVRALALLVKEAPVPTTPEDPGCQASSRSSSTPVVLLLLGLALTLRRRFRTER